MMITTRNKKGFKNAVLAAGFLCFAASGLFAQSITTAAAYFKTVSEKYAALKAYEADFEISMDKTETAGHLSFKAPDLLRMDFSNPNEQVIVFSSDLLTIYLPENSAVLRQAITSDNSGATLATPQGLGLMSRYYTVAYESGQSPEPLEAESDEMVVKLILTRKTTSEAFHYIKVAVTDSTKLIRRIEAVTTGGSTFIFNFYDYKLNPDISDQRFIYDAPSSANEYNNFLFTE